MYYVEVRHPVPDEIQLIDYAGRIAGIAIERDRSQMALARAFEKIENSEGQLRLGSQSLGSWPADACLIRQSYLQAAHPQRKLLRGATWRARPCPVTRVGENQSCSSRLSTESIHWPFENGRRIFFVGSTKRVHARQVSWPNDSHLRSHKIDSHSTPNTRFRGLLQALLSCHSCLVINYIAINRYAHNPKVGG